MKTHTASTHTQREARMHIYPHSGTLTCTPIQRHADAHRCTQRHARTHSHIGTHTGTPLPLNTTTNC